MLLTTVAKHDYRVARLSARLTLEQIAEEAGLSVNTVRQFEADPRSVRASSREALEPVYRVLVESPAASTFSAPLVLGVRL